MTGAGFEVPRHNDPVLAAFYAETSFPSTKALAFLREKGVPRRAIVLDGPAGVEGHSIGAAKIVLDGAGSFDFASPDQTEAIGAFVVVARDAVGTPLDLVAWHPKTDTLASMLGRAAVLGLQDYYAPQLLGVPIVFRSMLGWLRAERRGAVIVDRRRAGRVLLETPGRIGVEDDAMAREVADLLKSTVDLGRIVIPISGDAAGGATA